MRLQKHKFHKDEIIKDDNRNFTITRCFVSERLSNNKIIRENAYECICNICKYVMVKKESEVFRGRGCPCCNGKIVIEGINDIPTTAPWMINYFQGGYDEARLYTKSSNKMIYPKCPDCGKIKKSKLKISNIYNKKSIGCTCSYKGTSYPERFMISILDQLGITYEWQFKPEWLKGKRFDFCIQSLNLIIETDGRIGHGNYVWGKHDYANLMNKSKEIDDWKDKLAYRHGYSVIRIDCANSDFEYIKTNVINSELKGYFDLSNIDFSKCEKYALNNKCKDICEFWENNQHLTCKELGELFNCGTYTITQYLKKGNEIGWCSYNTIDAKRKAIEKTKLYYKNNKRKSKYDDVKVIAINKNGEEFLFNSITEATLNTGVRQGRIKDVCEQKKYYNSAGGYIWKYAPIYQ